VGDAGGAPADALARLDALQLEVVDRVTVAVQGCRIARPQAVGEVVLICIHFADGGNQVVKAALGGLEDRIGVGAVLTPAVFPALALLSDEPGGHPLLPLDPAGAGRVLARNVTGAGEIDRGADVAAAAIEVLLHPGVDLRQDPPGVGEIPVADRMLAADEIERHRGRCRSRGFFRMGAAGGAFSERNGGATGRRLAIKKIL
jgi:hypothetical protein